MIKIQTIPFFLYDRSMSTNTTTFWTPLWSQSMAKEMFNGKLVGRNKTICFQLKAYVGGTNIRLRFSNASGLVDYQIASMTVWIEQACHRVTMNGKSAFPIPRGTHPYSDVLNVRIHANDVIEVRIFFTTVICDANRTETSARLYRGDQTMVKELMITPLPNRVNRVLGIYNAVPSLELIEVETTQEAKVIVAFGDSITAMNRWVEPLREHLHEKFNDNFVLLNAGISGNCLLYEVGTLFRGVFGRKAVDRFKTDVLDVNQLHTVIFALGINDMSYYRTKTKDIINFERFQSALMDITHQLQARNVRIVVCTLTPRMGFKLLKFTREMEELRVRINDWIRSCDSFDGVFDMDAVIRDAIQRNVIDARYHQGDHLHPNEAGGQKIADAIDLDLLVGRVKES